jgi:hypothetical protein
MYAYRVTATDFPGLQVPNIRLLAQLVASDPSFTAVATAANTPIKGLTQNTIPEAIPTSSET